MRISLVFFLCLLTLTAFRPAVRIAQPPARVVSVSQTLAKMKDNSAYFEALVATKLEPLLDGPGGSPYPNNSVFAPTNAAMAQLKHSGMAYLFTKGQERKLHAVMAFSIVAGAAPALDLHDAQVLHTAHGSVTLQVVQRSGRTWLTGGTPEPLELRAKPIVCDNGSIYVIDKVLVPLRYPEPTSK